MIILGHFDVGPVLISLRIIFDKFVQVPQVDAVRLVGFVETHRQENRFSKLLTRLTQSQVRSFVLRSVGYDIGIRFET